MPVNFEFKARVSNLVIHEQLLQEQAPLFKGEDHQVDTYFNVTEGRLKLREGNIENSLIFYNRQDVTGPKQSDVLLYDHTPSPGLKNILARVHGIKVVVDKIRRIYFIENVKFHFDEVVGLGQFIEVEAIDETGTQGLEKIQAQCLQYAALFKIQEEDYVGISYSDLLLQKLK